MVEHLSGRVQCLLFALLSLVCALEQREPPLFPSFLHKSHWYAASVGSLRTIYAPLLEV